MRFAIAGYGYIAHYHARGILASGGTLAAIIGRDVAKAAAFALEHAVDGVAAPVFATVTEAVNAGVAAQAPLEALVLALPNSLHAPVAIEAMSAGLHVLVDKPMALDGNQARRMTKSATKNDRCLLIGHMWRYDPQALWLRDEIASGTLGEVVKTKAYGIHVNWGPAGWFVDPELAGGGALIDMGVHAIDTTRMLIGDPKPLSVYARLDTRFGDYAVDDFGLLVIEWDNKVTSVIESGWWNPHMDGAEASTQVFGTKAYGRLFPNEIRTFDGETPVLRVPDFAPREDHCAQEIYTAQIAGFIEAIRAGKTPYASAEVGTVIMDLCDAAYRSSSTGEVVRF